MVIMSLSKEIELYEKEIEMRTFNQAKGRIVLKSLMDELQRLKKD